MVAAVVPDVLLAVVPVVLVVLVVYPVPPLVVVALGSTVVVPPPAVSPLSLVAFLEEQLISMPALNKAASAVSLTN